MSLRTFLRFSRLPGALSVVALALVAIALAAAPLIGVAPAQAQGSTSMGVDVDSAGNGAGSIGGINGCVEVATGESFSTDVYISNVQGLSAWELTFGFDPSVIELTAHNNKLFLVGSFDASEPIPDSDGEHFVGVATLGGGKSGSGVLTRLTFTAKAPGRSPAAIVMRDANGDGLLDIGPRLNPSANPLGDINGDGVFDGPISQGEIAVDEPCIAPPDPGPGPAPTPTPSPGGGGSPGDGGPDGDGNGSGDSGGGAGSGSSGGGSSSPAGDSSVALPAASDLVTDTPTSGPDGNVIVVPGVGSQSGAAGEEDGDVTRDADAADGTDDDSVGVLNASESGGDSGGTSTWVIATLGILIFAALGGAALVIRSLRNPA